MFVLWNGFLFLSLFFFCSVWYIMSARSYQDHFLRPYFGLWEKLFHSHRRLERCSKFTCKDNGELLGN